MNEQLPPVDQALYAQLARRSAGQLPEGLTAQVLEAVDRAPVKPRLAWRDYSPRPARGIPTTLAAAASLAAVALLAAALVMVPRLQAPAASGLAGYAADRALTTAELARLMAGPALPTNTALVANVNIYVRSDTCPMNRYRTVGIVEGMASQVCVVTASDVLNQPFALSGTFAFRYLAPGVLGLLGEITPASSSRVAFRVVDDWPLQGKTFLVDGWLGAEGLLESCASAPTAGDPLAPDGSDCPYDDWLGDESTAPGIQADHEYSPPSPLPSYDPLSLRGNARHVEAGGMRLIDSLNHDSAAMPDPAIHGVFVVRAVTEGCPGESSVSSVGCPAWRVLAKVADISLPERAATPSPAPTGTPGAPATPLAPSLAGVIGAGTRPLSMDELVGLMLTQPDHLAGRIVIAKAPIPTYIYCHPDSNGVGVGCSVDNLRQTETGDWAVSIGADGTLSLIGQVSTPATGGYVFTLQQLQAKSGGPSTGLAIVDAWLDWETRCDTLPTEPPDRVCHFSLLFPDKPKWMHMTPDSTAQYVKPDDAYLLYGSQASYGEAFHGLFLMRADTGSTPTILARLETDTPSAGPVTTTPATPTATRVPSPGGSEVAPTALFGNGNRPLTVAEFPTLWAADPAHLAGRIVIVKGPVPAGFECSGVRPTDAPATTSSCYANTVDVPLAPEGYWVVQVRADGMLEVVGELSTPTSGFVFSLDEARALWSSPGSDKALILVDAWIGGMGADACDVVGQPCYEVSWLAPSPDEVSWIGSSPADGQLNVQAGAYHRFGGGKIGGGPAIQGIFLVQSGAGDGQVLARMEVAVP